MYAHTHTKKKKLHNVWATFQNPFVFLVSVDCNRMPEQVDHCLHPNGGHCYFKRADICWRAERGSFQRNDESPVLDCSKRPPWADEDVAGRVERRKKALLIHILPPCLHLILPFSHTLNFHPILSVLDFNVIVVKNVFGNMFKETTFSAVFVRIDLMDKLRQYFRCFPLVCEVVWLACSGKVLYVLKAMMPLLHFNNN